MIQSHSLSISPRPSPAPLPKRSTSIRFFTFLRLSIPSLVFFTNQLILTTLPQHPSPLLPTICHCITKLITLILLHHNLFFSPMCELKRHAPTNFPFPSLFITPPSIKSHSYPPILSSLLSLCHEALHRLLSPSFAKKKRSTHPPLRTSLSLLS